jgi:hypothetical protein
LRKGRFGVGEETNLFRFDVDLGFGGESGNTVGNLSAAEFRVCFDLDEVNAVVPLYHCVSQRFDEYKLVVTCHSVWQPIIFTM